MSYVDPIIQKYQSLIEAQTSVFKKFYQGQPTKIPASNLPCCIISKISTEVRPLNNAADEHAIGILLTVVTDVRQDLSTNINEHDLVANLATLYDIVEGRNAADYTLKTDSILNILRTNIEVDTANNLRTDLSTVTRSDYDAVRDRDQEEWTTEANIAFVAHFTQNR